MAVNGLTDKPSGPSKPVGKCVSVRVYWAVQAGLLAPLTFARHRLSPLAAFTSGAYFLHNRDNGS